MSFGEGVLTSAVLVLLPASILVVGVMSHTFGEGEVEAEGLSAGGEHGGKFDFGLQQ